VALSAQFLEYAGARRRMLVAAPIGPASSIVLSLHGSRSSPEREAFLSRMEPWSGRGVVVAFPEGSLPSGSGSEWDLRGDVAFLEAVVDRLREDFRPSSPQLGLTGMSGGARMASRFASLQTREVAVLGAVAGLRAPPGATVARPVRVVAFHGTSDRINPYAGSGTARWNESVMDAAIAWARANGVPAEPREEAVSPTLTRVSFGGEEEPDTVTLWVSKGAGHTWPGSRLPLLYRLFLGKTSFELDATTEIGRAMGLA
jgi:polyhydroxybutyrate depolymerase